MCEEEDARVHENACVFVSVGLHVAGYWFT